MGIRNKTVIKEQFITSDDMIFNNKEEALEHEYKLIRERLYSNGIQVYEYTIYLITNEEEIEAIKNDIYRDCQFNLPEELSYPFFMCETTYDDYYHCYWTLDDTIKHEESLLEALKNINIKEA